MTINEIGNNKLFKDFTVTVLMSLIMYELIGQTLHEWLGKRFIDEKHIWLSSV